MSTGSKSIITNVEVHVSQKSLAQAIFALRMPIYFYDNSGTTEHFMSFRRLILNQRYQDYIFKIWKKFHNSFPRFCQELMLNLENGQKSEIARPFSLPKSGSFSKRAHLTQNLINFQNIFHKLLCLILLKRCLGRSE